MSIVISYFFNWHGTLDELESEFRTWIGCDLKPYEGESEDLFCRFLGMEFSLNKQDYLENDRELNFEDYRFEVSIRTPIPDADFRPFQLITMASIVYTLYRRLGIIDGILVFDVERLLARYEQRLTSSGEGQLYDLVSGEYVNYPQPFTSLMHRLPEGSFGNQWETPTIEYLRESGYDIKIDGS